MVKEAHLFPHLLPHLLPQFELPIGDEQCPRRAATFCGVVLRALRLCLRKSLLDNQGRLSYKNPPINQTTTLRLA